MNMNKWIILAVVISGSVFAKEKVKTSKSSSNKITRTTYRDNEGSVISNKTTYGNYSIYRDAHNRYQGSETKHGNVTILRDREGKVIATKHTTGKSE